MPWKKDIYEEQEKDRLEKEFMHDTRQRYERAQYVISALKSRRIAKLAFEKGIIWGGGLVTVISLVLISLFIWLKKDG